MDRFILFGGGYYYARGGLHDLIDSFPNIEDAIAAGSAMKQRSEAVHGNEAGGEPQIEWWHIVDSSTWKIVAATEEQAYGAPRSSGT